MDVYFSKANKDDRIGLDKTTKDLKGKLFEDKGCISGRHKIELKKQTMLKTEQLKRTFSIENQKIRSFYWLCAMIVSAIISYSLKSVNTKLILALI